MSESVIVSPTLMNKRDHRNECQEWSSTIRLWRGRRLQKQAADILGIPIRTLQAYEYGLSRPDPIRKVELLRRMEAGKETIESQR